MAYTLMIGEKPGRAEKAETLFAWVRANGADTRAIAALEAEPLGATLAGRVRGLTADAVAGGISWPDERIL